MNSIASTIFARITSNFGGAVCVVRISGNSALEFLKYTSCKEVLPKVATIAKLFDENGDFLDEIVIVYFKSPKSFTGEDVLEISIHNSQYIYSKLVDLLRKNLNFNPAKNGEFLYRSVLNGKKTILQAEAINDLIASESKIQHKMSIRGMSDDVYNQYKLWHDKLFDVYAKIQAYIDFSQEELDDNMIGILNNEIKSIKLDLEVILSRNNTKKVQNGINITLVGDVNAGKSSLLNAIVKEHAAIVSNIPGTTRDIISKKCIIGDYVVIIHDTAGIRDTSDVIEQQGVELAKKCINSSDIRLFLFAKGEVDNDLLNSFYQPNDILVCSKSDLLENEAKNGDMVKISSINRNGIDDLLAKIQENIGQIIGKVDESVCFSERQYELIQKAFYEIEKVDFNKPVELTSEDIRVALGYLEDIFGVITTDDVLGNIFSKFCIGK